MAIGSIVRKYPTNYLQKRRNLHVIETFLFFRDKTNFPVWKINNFRLTTDHKYNSLSITAKIDTYSYKNIV